MPSGELLKIHNTFQTVKLSTVFYFPCLYSSKQPCIILLNNFRTSETLIVSYNTVNYLSSRDLIFTLFLPSFLSSAYAQWDDVTSEVQPYKLACLKTRVRNVTTFVLPIANFWTEGEYYSSSTVKVNFVLIVCGPRDPTAVGLHMQILIGYVYQ